MPVDPGTIPSIPTPVPQSSDPVNFPARGDAVMTALPGVVAGMNTASAATKANADEVLQAVLDITGLASLAAEATESFGYMVGNLTVSAGTKAITLTAAKTGFLVNERVAIVSRADPTIRMFGTIAASPTPTTTAFSVTVVSSGVFGSGTYSDWIVMSAAFLAQGATAAELLAQATDGAAVTPKVIKDAKGWVVLPDAATVTPNGLSGRNFTWTIGGNRTLGAITNCAPNDVFRIAVTQDGTGGRVLAWATGVYFRGGGLPVLPTSAGAKAFLKLEVVSVDGSGTATYVLASFVGAPTN